MHNTDVEEIDKSQTINIVKNVKKNFSFPPIKFKSIKSLSRIIVIVFALSITSIAAYYVNKPKEITTTTATEEEGVEEQLLEFPSDQLLVKVKREVKGKIKEDFNDTGVASLTKIFKEEKVKKFKQIAKQGKKSDTSADVFDWYLIEMNVPQENVTAKLDKVTKKLQSLTPNEKEEKMIHTQEAIFALQAVIDKLSEDPNIEEIEPNYMVKTQLVPNDPYYNSTGAWGQSYKDMYGLHIIDAVGAWDQTTGSQNMVVAVIDTGVDRNHSDLTANMWTNQDEIPDNGKDDDGNGYIDDYYGWDFFNDDNDPMDDSGHGTHCAGTIGAVGNNNLGIVGVNWKANIMALKFLSDDGFGYSDRAILALQYAADMGAKISSNSWSGAGSNIAIDDAIKYEHDKGMVIAVAAGNSNRDAYDYSPTNSDYAIAVAASDYNDEKAYFSNWGEKIDVAAPGVNILSLKASINKICTEAKGNIIGEDYCVVSGTSMATPHVAGLASLLLSKNPLLTPEGVRQILRSGADDLGEPGKDPEFGYGRINAKTTLALSDSQPLTPVITSPPSRTLVQSLSISVAGIIGGQNFRNFEISVGLGRLPTEWITLASSNSQVVEEVIDVSVLPDGEYLLRLTAYDKANNAYDFTVGDLKIDFFDVLLDNPGPAVELGVVDIYGTALSKNDLEFGNYVIEWGVGSVYNSPSSWSSEGISLVNNGLNPVSSDLLATWDTGVVDTSFSVLVRLTVRSPAGAYSEEEKPTMVDQDLVGGWPIKINNPNRSSYDGNIPTTIADLNNDGVKEIITGSPDNKIYVFNKDGSNFQNFPITTGRNEKFVNTIIVDDIDFDGQKEIITASRGDDTVETEWGNCSGCRRIYIFNNDGSLYEGWPLKGLLGSNQIITVADFGNDKHILAISLYDNAIHAYHPDGSEHPGFPKKLPYSLDYMTPADAVSADIDNDGTVEIIVRQRQEIHLLDTNANLLWTFHPPPYDNGQEVSFKDDDAVTLADINGDGNLEIFVVDHVSAGNPIKKVFAIDKDGIPLPGWPKDSEILEASSQYLMGPSSADVDMDGKDELILGMFHPLIMDSEGIVDISIAGWKTGRNQPALSDVDGDGNIEFTAVRYNEITIFKNDGQIYWTRDLPSESYNDGSMGPGAYNADPSLFSDLDNDGIMELVVSESRTHYFVGSPYVYLWEISNNGGTAQYEWEMFAHDPQRTARLVTGKTPSTPIPTPTLPGDINGDGVVNIQDYILLSNAFGTNNEAADINNDGIVNIQDYIILSNNFGKIS